MEFVLLVSDWTLLSYYLLFDIRIGTNESLDPNKEEAMANLSTGCTVGWHHSVVVPKIHRSLEYHRLYAMWWQALAVAKYPLHCYWIGKHHYYNHWDLRPINKMGASHRGSRFRSETDLYWKVCISSTWRLCESHLCVRLLCQKIHLKFLKLLKNFLKLNIEFKFLRYLNDRWFVKFFFSFNKTMLI